jgi:hypothetical protein
MSYPFKKFSLLPVTVIILFFFNLISERLSAQARLSIEKVYSAYLRNSGTISAQGQIK